jgi:PAS domain S-box-containing protein
MPDATLSEQNRLLLQEVKRRTNQMAAINIITSVVGQSLDLDRTLATALEIAVEVVDAEASGISLIDREAGELVLRAQRGWVQDFVVSNPMRIPLGTGFSGQVLEQDRVVVDNDLTGQEDFAVPSFRDEHFRSIAMAPMHARGRIIGILSVMSNEPHRFDQEVVDVLRVVADTVGVALENARLYAEMSEQTQRLSAVLHSTLDGIIATDADSRISMVNNAAEDLLGVPAPALIDMPLREAPIDSHIRTQLLKALAAPDEGQAFQVTLDDGRVIAVSVSPVSYDNQLAPVTIQDAWVIVLQDVTHLRQAEIARARFMQAAAHDMRNPLSVTYSSIVTLQNLIPERTGAVDEVIGLALDGVQRVHTLIDDLLHLEQVKSGHNFNVQPFNLLDVLHEVEQQAFMLLAGKGQLLTLDIAEELPTLQADVRWFKRAVHNYLGNAATHTPPGGEVTLKVYADDDAEWVHVEVIDTGPGIPVADQARIWDRFYRVTGNRAAGSGLGLAIVKSVVEAHGGAVYLHSRVGEGCRFGFKLPVNPPEGSRRALTL